MSLLITVDRSPVLMPAFSLREKNDLVTSMLDFGSRSFLPDLTGGAKNSHTVSYKNCRSHDLQLNLFSLFFQIKSNFCQEPLHVSSSYTVFRKIAAKK